MEEILFDVSPWKGTDKVKEIRPTKRGMLPYWEAYATLTVIVNGRDLQFELRLRGETGEARAVGRTCLAAAFLPGTE